jgi:orotidine-5'-phosphate decarboxylase
MASIVDLVQRAEAASARMSVKNPNRGLLRDLCVGLVAQAQRIAMLEAQSQDRPLIVTPGYREQR